MDALLHDLLFYILASIVLISAFFTALSSRLVHAAFSLLFTFFGLACMYIYLGADFVGITQVLIYVGGILVLLLFGVMFTGRESAGAIKQSIQRKWGVVLFVILLILLIPVLVMTPWPTMPKPETKPLESTISPVGDLLLTKYLLPFEVASLLLLVALIGAVVIARGLLKSQPDEEKKDVSIS